MTRKGAIRYVDIDPSTIPENCQQIVITQNKTRIVIRNHGAPVTSSVANKHELIMLRVQEFFDKEKNFVKVKPLLMQTSRISLRLLDWTATNWAKVMRVVLTVDRGHGAEKVNIHLDYKNYLKSFSKRSFDPFCRRERIFIKFACDEEQKTYVSTAAQMNFFKWAIHTGVVEYCEQNIDEIEKHMVTNMRVRTVGAREQQQLPQSPSEAPVVRPCRPKRQRQGMIEPEATSTAGVGEI